MGELKLSNLLTVWNTRMASKKEPPFFNEDNIGSCHCKLAFCETMELLIETLTGTCFELRVSPFETVISVKAKIQRLEGIPVSQQHLIWNNVELEDDYSLNDYSISEGCTLKLILAMRGGPINTKRVPVEDPIKEITEYMDPFRNDVWEKVPSSKHATFLVYREGDQLNFFRVVDRGDGTLTPLSESLSGGSIYNFYADDDEDTETSPSGQQIIENSITMNKMKLLKAKMENMNLNKKPKNIIKVNPHSPLVFHPSCGSTTAAHPNFLRALPHIGQSCLPSENSCSSGISQNALSVLASSGKKMSCFASHYLKENDKWEGVSPSQSDNMKMSSKGSCLEKEEAKLSENFVVPQDPDPLINLEKNVENGTPSTERCSFLYPDLTNVNIYSTEKTDLSDKEAFALVAEATCTESCREICGTEKENMELQLSEDSQNKYIGKHTNSATADNSIFNSHELNLKKSARLSPLHCSTQMAHYSPQKSQAHSKYFEVGSLKPTSSPSVLKSLELHSIADSSCPRTSKFHGIGLDSPGKRSDIHSKADAREVTEVAIKASKDPFVSVNNIGLLSSLTRNANRDGLQNACGSSRYRTSGIALTTNFQHFQEETFRMSSPHNDMPGYFLSPGLALNGNIVASGKRMDVETTSVQLIAMQRLTPVLTTTRTQDGNTYRTPILLSALQSFPKSKHSFAAHDCQKGPEGSSSLELLLLSVFQI